MKGKPKVLIIYTGGTIGMIKDSRTGELTNVDFNLITEHVPEINRLNIEIDSVSFKEPIDSSTININHWKELSNTIFENYTHYDGFVVLHGSDTMAYSASAMSFLLSGLQKPIIFTGSQLPIGVIRTDGKENLITALEIAAEQDENNEPLIKEVALYFDYQLFRGNRSTKDSAENFEAFKSPNYHPLAVAGVNLRYFHEHFLNQQNNELHLQKEICNQVGLIKFYPGIDLQLYKSLFDIKQNKGVVIETFGSGNAILSTEDEAMVNSFIQSGGKVLNITQCNSGSVEQGKYESSSVFNRLGVYSGQDLTTEAAITKMMVILGEDYPGNKEKDFLIDLRGELSFR